MARDAVLHEMLLGRQRRLESLKTAADDLRMAAQDVLVILDRAWVSKLLREPDVRARERLRQAIGAYLMTQ